MSDSNPVIPTRETPFQENAPSNPNEVFKSSAEPALNALEPSPFPDDPAPLSWARAFFGAMGIGLIFACFGFLVELYDVARFTLPHILVPGPDLQFLEVSDGLPIPRLLDWNLHLIDLLTFLNSLRGPTYFLTAAVLMLPLLLVAIRVLNPTFRLLRVHAPDLTNRHLFAAAFEANSLGKVIRLLLPVGFLVALVWFVSIRWEGAQDGRFAGIRWLTLGVALWVAFSQRGLAGSFHSRFTQSIGIALPSLLLAGGLFGFGVYLLGRLGLPHSMDTLLARFEMLGTFHRGTWQLVASRYQFGVAAVWFGSGTLLFAFGQPSLRLGQRMALLCFPIVGLGIALNMQSHLNPRSLAARYDITPELLKTLPPITRRSGPTARVPVGREAARLFAQRTGLSLGATPASPERSALFFVPGEVINIRLMGTSEDGLTATPASVTRAENFLEERHYQTAFSWVAIKHLHNTAMLQFDPARAIEVMLLSQERCPHQARTGTTLRAALFTCAASPANLELLNRYADSQRFAFPDRASVRLIGDMYTRFGEPAKALEWYRRADMPKSFMAKIRTQKPMFRAGRLTGTLTLNGKPVSGVRVGAVALRLNGLPSDLESLLLDAERNTVGTPFPTAFAPAFTPRPYNLRWVSAGATTDATGRFVIEHLTEGEYRLIAALPPSVKLEPPIDAKVKVTNALDRLTLNYASPQCDLGTIAVSVGR
jgi:hypothetical protein